MAIIQEFLDVDCCCHGGVYIAFMCWCTSYQNAAASLMFCKLSKNSKNIRIVFICRPIVWNE